MAKRLTQIHIHTQYAHRCPEKVYRRLSGVQAVKPNRHGITHQANIVSGGNDLRVYLNVEGQWHGYPFGADLEIEPKQKIGEVLVEVGTESSAGRLSIREKEENII